MRGINITRFVVLFVIGVIGVTSPLGSAVGARPLQHLEVPFKRRHPARVPTPRAAVCMRPLQYLELPAARRSPARILVPRAAVSARPLQHFKVSFPCRTIPRFVVPRARLHAPTEAPRAVSQTPPYDTSTRSMGILSRTTTVESQCVHPAPPNNTSSRPTVFRSRATPSTLRIVHLSPLPHKGILDATGDLAVAGAPPRLNNRGCVRHAFH